MDKVFKHPSNILMLLSISIMLSAFVFYKIDEPEGIFEQEIEFQTKVAEYPDVRSDKIILVVENNELGRIRVSADTLNKYSYGEILNIKGKIKEPENFDNFNWRGYLAKENINYEMRRPNIEKTGKTEKDVFYFSATLKDKLQQGINSSLLPPHSSLYSAMILANKGSLSQKQKDNIASAGLSHIIAISGMHISIILIIILGTLIKAGLNRRVASIAVLGIMVFYILMIGAPASAVRAGIMVAIFILAQLLGRPNFSWRALVLAGGVMALFNPYIVRYDIGFQLSFLAVLGILLFHESIEKFLYKAQYKFVELVSRGHITKDRKWATYAAENKFGFISILAITISAQALTFPLIIYNFGNFSIASPITNLLVVPVLPFALVAGFVTATASSMLPAVVSIILAAPAWMFSEYIWKVVSIFS